MNDCKRELERQENERSTLKLRNMNLEVELENVSLFISTLE